MISYVLLLSIIMALVHFSLAHDFSGGLCYQFTQQHAATRAANPCYGVVDYPFYLESLSELPNLIAQVSEATSNTLLTQLSDSCRSAILKLECSKVFLKCAPDVDVSDTSTYTYDTYNVNNEISLPFQKPCIGVCQSWAGACSTDPLYKLAYGSKLMTECTSTTNYAKDSSINPTTTYNTVDGNCATPQTAAVGSTTETYIGSLCKPYVSGTIYIPPASKVSSQLTSFLPQYTIQTLIEQTLVSKLSELPKFTKDTIYSSILKYQCLQYFMPVQTVTVQQAVEDSNVNPAIVNGIVTQLPEIVNRELKLPKYPAREVCTTYEKTASPIFSSAPSLVPDCDKLADPSGLTHTFPEGDQPVYAYSTSGATILFYTSPNEGNYYDATSFTYQPECPDVFVQPDNPEDPDIIWLSFSGCALPCLVNLWEENEWDLFQYETQIASTLSFILGVILFAYIGFNRDFKRQYMLTIFTIVATFASAYVCVSSLTYSDTERYCKDNAVPQMQKDGDSMCIIEGIIAVYCYLCCCTIGFLLTYQYIINSLGTYAWVTKKWWYYLIQFICAFVFPIIVVAYAYDHEYFGNSRSQPFCFIMVYPYADDKNMDTKLTAYPIVFLWVFSFTSILAYEIYVLLTGKGYRPRKLPNNEIEADRDDTRAVESVEDLEPEHCFIERVFLFAAMATIFFPFIIYRFKLRDDFSRYQSEIRHWATCVLTNYNLGNDWLGICDDRPENRPKRSMYEMQIFVMYGMMIIVTPCYILASLIKKGKFGYCFGLAENVDRELRVKKGEVKDFELEMTQ